MTRKQGSSSRKKGEPTGVTGRGKTDPVRAAIEAAEQRSGAEYFAVLALRSSDYRMEALTFLAFWLLACVLMMLLGLNWFLGSLPPATVLIVAAGQLAAFVSFWIVLRAWPWLGVYLVPARIARERAHLNAVRQFRAHGIDATDSRNGVLVFVSLAERYGEILVDRGIEEALGRQPFLDEIARLTRACADGDCQWAIAQSITRLSEVIGEAIPPGRDNANVLADRLVILPAEERG